MYMVRCENCKKTTQITEQEMQRSPKAQRVLAGEEGQCAWCYVGVVNIKVTAKKETKDAQAN